MGLCARLCPQKSSGQAGVLTITDEAVMSVSNTLTYAQANQEKVLTRLRYICRQDCCFAVEKSVHMNWLGWSIRDSTAVTLGTDQTREHI